MMKRIQAITAIALAIIALLLLLFVLGCAQVRVTRPDGTEIKYTRWGNQSLESFLMEADGSVLFEKQKSDNAELYEALNTLAEKLP